MKYSNCENNEIIQEREFDLKKRKYHIIKMASLLIDSILKNNLNEDFIQLKEVHSYL